MNWSMTTDTSFTVRRQQAAAEAEEAAEAAANADASLPQLTLVINDFQTDSFLAAGLTPWG